MSATNSALRYVTDLHENDVLLGRGQPILNYSGNLNFRRLIVSNRDSYTSTGKHAVKDEIARRIMQQIAESGGRFLRKIEDEAEREQLGITDSCRHVWLIVDEATRLQKVKQALREQLSKSDSSASSGRVASRALSAQDTSHQKRKFPTSGVEKVEMRIATLPLQMPASAPIERNFPPRNDAQLISMHGVAAMPQESRNMDQSLLGILHQQSMPPLHGSTSLPYGQENHRLWNPLSRAHYSGSLTHQFRPHQRPVGAGGPLDGLDLLARMKVHSVSERNLLLHREQALALLQQQHGALGFYQAPDHQPYVTMREIMSMRANSLANFLLQRSQQVQDPSQPYESAASSINFDNSNRTSLLTSLRPDAGGLSEALLIQQLMQAQQEQARLIHLRSMIAAAGAAPNDGKQSEAEAEGSSPEDSKPKAKKKKSGDAPAPI